MARWRRCQALKGGRSIAADAKCLLGLVRAMAGLREIGRAAREWGLAFWLAGAVSSREARCSIMADHLVSPSGGNEYMENYQLCAQGDGLRGTAETMIKAGLGNHEVEASTRATVEALVQACKQSKGSNPVVAALDVPPNIKWGEVLTIANVIFKS